MFESASGGFSNLCRLESWVFSLSWNRYGGNGGERFVEIEVVHNKMLWNPQNDSTVVDWYRRGYGMVGGRMTRSLDWHDGLHVRRRGIRR